MVASVILAAGMGLAMAPATESIMGSLPPAQAGVGSAVNDTTRELGGALGVAIMGSAASSLFAGHLRPFLDGVPGTYAASARASVGAAVTIGHHLPGPAGQLLVEGARHAFISGADQATLVALAAALLGAVVAAVFLPARATGTAPRLRTAPEPGHLELAQARAA
jgi:hypothetical protein